MENRQIVRSAFSMGMVTLASRVFGLLREWVRGYLLGTTHSSDAFTLAFMFPNLMRRLVGEGALMAAFVPVMAEFKERESREALDRFVHSFITVLLIALVVMVAAVMAGAPLLKHLLPRYQEVPGKIELTVMLTRLMFPYLLFISLAALSQGILNAYRVFVPSAATPILLNICIVSFGLLAGGVTDDPATALGFGVLAGGVVQFFFQMPFLRRLGISYRFRLRPRNRGVVRVFRLMVPGAVGAGVHQLNILAAQFITASLGEGSVAALRFSVTMVELVLGIFVISLTTVILPVLSGKSARGDLEGMKESLRFALRLVLIITFPATVGLLLLRFPLIRMLFRYGRFTEESVGMVSGALLYHSLGLAGIGASRVMVQMFYSLKDTRTPVYLAAMVMAANVALCFALRGPLGLGGIALAGSATAFMNYLLLAWFLRRKVGGFLDRATGISALKSLGASLAMLAALYALRETAAEFLARGRLYNTLGTLGLILAGVLLFTAASLVLKNRDILALRDALARRLLGR
ncbi:MAG: murein biosynthesis integral membrane protein MurJ [Spirochaetota bacterium]